MTLLVGTREIMTATGRSPNTNTARLRPLPFRRGAFGRKTYAIQHVLPRYTSDRANFGTLLKLARDDGDDLNIGDTAVADAVELEHIATPDQQLRIRRARYVFSQILATVSKSSALMEYQPYLQHVCILYPDLIHWIFGNHGDDYRDIDGFNWEWVGPFAIQHSGHNIEWDCYNSAEKEPA